jgi:tRNA G37 N-methylase TrmD
MLALAAALHIQDMPVMASPVPQAGVEAEEETGDDLDLIENGSTAYSQATPCQLTVTTECPEQFGQNTYVLLTDDEGKNYRVSLLAENSHTDNIYLAPGHYRITDVAVFDDYKNEYPFDISVSEVNLSADEAAAVSFRLSDFDVIQSNADGAIWTDPSTEISEEYETGIAGVTITNSGNLV